MLPKNESVHIKINMEYNNNNNNNSKQNAADNDQLIQEL